MTPLTNDYKILIKILHIEKGYSTVQMMCEFPAKTGTEVCFAILLNAATRQATWTGKRGYGRPRSVRTAANRQLVSDLTCSCPWNFANFYILHIILSHKKQVNKSLKQSGFY